MNLTCFVAAVFLPGGMAAGPSKCENHRCKSEGITLFQKSDTSTKLDSSISVGLVSIQDVASYTRSLAKQQPDNFQSSSFVSFTWAWWVFFRTTMGFDNNSADSNLQQRWIAAVDSSPEKDASKQFIIPILSMLVGFAIMTVPKAATVGKLVLYFGAQSTIIFLGWLLRTQVTVVKSKIPGTHVELDEVLHGVPAGFALAAMQQVTSFFCFLIRFAVLYATPYKLSPKKIHTKKELVSVTVFGCVFAVYIAFNNFSLGYISIDVNLIIRSCLPLMTYLSQQGLAMVKLSQRQPVNWLEIGLMVANVFSACAFTWAKIMGSGGSFKGSSDQGKQISGCVVCFFAVLCFSVTFALDGVLGEMKLDAYDTVVFMSIPAFLFLTPFCLVKKPVPGEWQQLLGMDRASDLDILMVTQNIAPSTFQLFALSGFFMFAYNIIQFSIVRTLCPTTVAHSCGSMVFLLRLGTLSGCLSLLMLRLPATIATCRS